MSDAAERAREHPRREASSSDAPGPAATRPEPDAGAPAALRLVDVYADAPADYDGTCLRPLGLCELGGACDSCWYNSNRPASLGTRPGEPRRE